MGPKYCPNLLKTQSRNKILETKKASVAPILLANEATKVPQKIPKIAPPRSVKTAAPGIDSAAARQ